MDVSKIIAQLEEARSCAPHTSSTMFVALLLSGALNPLHRGHTDILHAAAAAMNATSPTSSPHPAVRVVGLVLAPSSDSYVTRKLGHGVAMPLKQRVELCELAAAGDPLMSVLPRGNASGVGSADFVYDVVVEEWGKRQRPAGAAVAIAAAAAAAAAAGRSGRSDAHSFDIATRFCCLALYGSDFLCKYPTAVCKPLVIASRDDEEESAARAAEIVSDASSSGLLSPSFWFLHVGGGTDLSGRNDLVASSPQGPATARLPVAVGDYSSTAIRRALEAVAAGRGDEPGRPASKDGDEALSHREFLGRALHPAVLERLLAA